MFYRLESPNYNQLGRGTPRSFVDYGWWIISIPLAKLLIEGVMSRAAPPRLAVTDARATRQLKAACVTQMAVLIASGSVVCALWWLCPLWLRVSTQALLQSTLAAAESSDVKETDSRSASALLSAESEHLATQGKKSLPNHLLSSALWSNAGLARNQVSWLKHGMAKTRGTQSRGTLLLFSNGVYCYCIQCLHQVRVRPLKTGIASFEYFLLYRKTSTTG